MLGVRIERKLGDRQAPRQLTCSSCAAAIPTRAETRAIAAAPASERAVDPARARPTVAPDAGRRRAAARGARARRACRIDDVAQHLQAERRGRSRRSRTATTRACPGARSCAASCATTRRLLQPRSRRAARRTARSAQPRAGARHRRAEPAHPLRPDRRAPVDPQRATAAWLAIVAMALAFAAHRTAWLYEFARNAAGAWPTKAAAAARAAAVHAAATADRRPSRRCRTRRSRAKPEPRDAAAASAPRPRAAAPAPPPCGDRRSRSGAADAAPAAAAAAPQRRSRSRSRGASWVEITRRAAARCCCRSSNRPGSEADGRRARRPSASSIGNAPQVRGHLRRPPRSTSSRTSRVTVARFTVQ